MQRIVQPEILDSLKHDDPVALANRRDLRLYNCLMGNFRWFKKVVQATVKDDKLIELGAGDGSLGTYLKSKHILSEAHAVTGVDIAPRPAKWPEQWNWLQEDLRTVSLNGGTRTLLANMILHQFEDEDLRELGRRIVDSDLQRLYISEPARRRPHLWQVSLSRLLGVHAVSLHDASVSIRAGFRNTEVCQLLGLEPDDWSFKWTETFMGANRVIATRK